MRIPFLLRMEPYLGAARTQLIAIKTFPAYWYFYGAAVQRGAVRVA
jgi:hypothetical protein